MTDQEKRIKLALAMGWVNEGGGGRVWWHPTDSRSRCFPNHLPDPLTDANDDYAVLEWMLVGTPDSSHGRIYLGNKWDYKIGDYARAALKVIGGKV